MKRQFYSFFTTVVWHSSLFCRRWHPILPCQSKDWLWWLATVAAFSIPHWRICIFENLSKPLGFIAGRFLNWNLSAQQGLFYLCFILRVTVYSESGCVILTFLQTHENRPKNALLPKGLFSLKKSLPVNPLFTPSPHSSLWVLGIWSPPPATTPWAYSHLQKRLDLLTETTVF